MVREFQGLCLTCSLKQGQDRLSGLAGGSETGEARETSDVKDARLGFSEPEWICVQAATFRLTPVGPH